VDADITGVVVADSAGSVKATVTVAPPSEDVVTKMQKDLTDGRQEVAQLLDSEVKKMASLKNVLAFGKTAKDVKSSCSSATLVKGGVRSGGGDRAAVVSSAKHISIASTVAVMAYFAF